MPNQGSQDIRCLYLFFSFVATVSLVGAMRFKWGKPSPQFLPGSWFVRPRYWYYSGVPVGVGCILILIGIRLDALWLGWIGLVGFALTSLAFPVLKPRWVEPWWMSWLRKRYDWPTLEDMFDQAKKDPSAWAARISTQEGLERWVKEFECDASLHRHYDQSTIDFVLSKARQDDQWLDHVSTEEKLEAWARGIVERHKEEEQHRHEAGRLWRGKDE